MTNSKEKDFRIRWEKEYKMYEAWGNCVSQTLIDLIKKEINPKTLDQFLRMNIIPRIKNVDSLIAKAFYRGKSYNDPYDDIEDKVGIRIVLLFSEEVKTVGNLIKSYNEWKAVKARDFEEEKISNPFEFDYQSLHYIVRSKSLLTYKGVEIKENIPCEIQIRTLLQHACCELSHDTIYKPSIQAKNDIKRIIARSRALIEVTDEYFEKVKEELSNAQKKGIDLSETLEKRYISFTGLKPEISPLNTLLIDYFSVYTDDDFNDKLEVFLNEKSYIKDCIKERHNMSLYKQPSILLVYWSIHIAPNKSAAGSPLRNDEIKTLYADLGISPPNFL